MVARHLLQARPAELRRVRRTALLHPGQPPVRVRGQRHGVRHQHLRGHLVLVRARVRARPRARRCCWCPTRRRSTWASRQQRLQIDAHATSRTFGMPLVYANLVGGQDELVFDGASFVLDARGDCRRAARRTSRKRCCWSISSTACRSRARASPSRSHEALAYSRAGARRARLRRQERLPGRADRTVGRRRFGAHAGDRGRCARRRPGARGDDAVAVHAADVPRRRRARLARQPRRALRRAPDQADASTPSCRRWRASSAGCRGTRPRKTCRRASAARC